MKLSDIKIGTKILAIIAAFGLSSIGMTLWQNANRAHAEDTYQNIITSADAALLAGSRMNQNVFAIDGAINGLAFQSCPSPACEIYETQIQKSDERFLQRYEQLIKAAPDYKADFEPLKDRFVALSDTVRNRYLPMAKNNEQAALAVELASQAAIVDKLTSDIRSAVDAKQKLNDAAIQTIGEKTKTETLMGLVISIAIVLLVTALASYIAFADIVGSIRRITDQMAQVSKGALDLKIDGQTRGDEIGTMAQTLEVFRQGLMDAETLRAEAEVIKKRAEEDRRRAMLKLADDFEASVGQVVAMVSAAATEMQASASQLTATAQETAAQSIAVSSAAEEAGTNVTSVASAAEEMGASVGEIGRQVASSAETSRAAVSQADAAGEVVNELSEVANSINGIVDLIAGLAGQTNLLALNATIESARAGEAGKGFAVVASEVKALAGQTAKATTDISERISQIQESTSKAATAFRTITSTIQNIDTTNAMISAAVEQQSAATREIIQAVNQASLGTQEVTINITGVARASEQTGDAAAQVLSSSGELAQQAERLRHEMDHFLATVRAA
ncbi:methyl-accepting chemotaxis protein (plasmid) [Asticcacaulis sp. DW145]|uniref:methyl-accepting chemotaxis protein n=1 Tax=Asticcacaulis sp. DW145 TaxID=3095608 RepID=UPI00308F7B8F|nr:methyl-accepting chemotaxis protein [Asticcacaulis sp. DW145]